MAGVQGIFGNPLLATLSPGDQQSFAQLSQQQAIGQALLQQGLQPMDAGTNAVGGMAYHVSPLNGVSKLLNAYIGNKLSMDAVGQQAQLASKMYGAQFGTDQQQPSAPSLPPVSGAADSPALTGPSAGMGGSQGAPDPVAVGRAMLANGQNVPMQTTTQAGPWTIPGMSAADSRSMYMLNPEQYAKLRMAYAQPTDATRMAISAHLDPTQANADALFKANYVPPVQVAPNQMVTDPRTGASFTTPAAAAPGSQNIQGVDGHWYTVPVAGGTAAIQAGSAADAAGKAGYQLTDVWDPTANNGQGGYVHQTVANAAGAAGGAIGSGQPPLPPGGVGSAPAGGAGVPPLPPESSLPGASPGGRSGPMASQPPIATAATAEAQARGQIDTMQQSYKEARQARSTGQNALSLLDDMSSYAQSKTPVLANKLFNVQGIYSSDAQLFEKARDNLISQVSGATGMNTDAARSIVEGAIPSYGMNTQALQTGLGQIKSQVQMRMLKGDYLADAYANGNAPAYNQRENQFDQMMTPTAAGIIKRPAGPARNAAIASAKGSPQDAQALRWALSVGLLR